MGVVVEPARIVQRRVERIFAGMAEWRVTEVMGKTQRFGEILVEAERPSHGPPDLRDLEAVREADAVMVAVGSDEHLRLVSQPPERHGMDQPVAIALEDVARPARAAIVFGMQPTPRFRGIAGNGC